MTRDSDNRLGSDPFEGRSSSYFERKEEKKVVDLKEARPPSEEPAVQPEAEPAEAEEFKHAKKVLNQLGEELDQFHENPKDYDRKRLESVVKDFIYELKKILADTGYFARIQDAMRPEEEGFLSRLNFLRKLVQSDEVDEYGLDRQFELAIKPFFDFIYYKYFRVDVRGIENLPYEGRCLLVSNHSGVIPWDAAMIKVAIFNEHPAKRELRFLVDDFVFHFPFLGTTINRMGGVRACQENAKRLLKQEELVAVFPEGIKGISKLFKDRYQLERFGRGGAIRLAMQSKAPICPVGVVGAEEIYPLVYKSHILARPLGLPFIPFTPLFPFLGPFGAVPLPTKWSIDFGKVIDYSQSTSSDLHDDILINRETERLRGQIQEMIKEALAERQSVFGV